jgi:RimJ/RimL family protein N-acetyltransferase
MTQPNPAWEPEGPLVSSIPATAPNRETTLVGKLVDLIPLNESHAEELYRDLGGVEHGQLYKYLPGGPFTDIQSFTDFIKSTIDNQSCVSFAIRSKDLAASEGGSPGPLVGTIIYLSIAPSNRSVEIGMVLFGQRLARTTAATEACYLMMKHAFEDLHNLRVEWKSNARNAASKRAALRLGFVFEGVFRKHMVVKGRSRDSAYFSVTDDEWEAGVKDALEGWLQDDNFDAQKMQKMKLEDIRRGIINKTK